MLRGVHLTVMIGPFKVEPVPQSVVDSITEVQVTHQSGQRSGFQITMTYGKGSQIDQELLPGRLFDPPARVVMVATVDGTPSVLMDGVVTRHDLAQSNQPGQAKLTITGTDITQMMDLIDLSGVPMPAMPPVAQVAFILARYAIFGLIPILLPSVAEFVPNPLDRVPTQQGTDYQHIQKLASDVGYVFFVVPGPAPGRNIAYWGPETKFGAVQPALSVNMDAASTVETLSFSTDGISKALLALYYLEKKTGFPIPIPLPGIVINPPLGPKIIPPLKLTALNKLDPDKDEDGMAKLELAELISRGVARAAQSDDVVTASGSLDVTRYGRLLEARKLVGVRGAGPVYDGLYYVKSTTTTLRRGALKQNFSLVRNAHGSYFDRVPV
jgi:hypothetical protein